MRITGGTLRGRRVSDPPRRVRPTTDRVREALFSILGQDLEGVTVLDAFAGSGLLGFEALSRGADHATFVEQDRATASRLRGQARALGVERTSRVVVGRTPGRLPAGSWDLVLLDPPYVLDPESTLEALAGRVRWQLVLEHGPEREAPTVAGFAPPDSRSYGSTVLSFYAPG